MANKYNGRPTPIASNGRLEVHESFNGYNVYDTITKETQGCGDGVDMYHDEAGEALTPGSKPWLAALRRDIKDNKNQWLEAYFGVV